MSIFGSIVSKIFGHAAASPAPASATAAPSPTASTVTPAPAAPSSGSATSFNNPAATSQAPGSMASASPPPQPANANQNVDVAAVLDKMLASSSQKFDWRHSIVDLMKLLGLDSSLSAREELAKELHYSGAMDGSAAMNLWLHKQVMQKLAENGGKVPDELK